MPQSPSPAELSQLGLLFSTRHYVELENQASALLGLYPNAGLVWELFGLSLQMQGKDSLRAFQKTAELLPDDAGAHYNLGVALKSIGRLEDAVAIYRRAIKLKPDFAMAHSNLGNVLKSLGQLEEAESSYRLALELKPGFAEAHNNLGNVLKERGQLENAVVSYRRAVEAMPNYADAHFNLGNVLKDIGQPDAAIASYHHALEIKPDYADAYVNLGNVLADIGQPDAAIASYHHALEIKPDYADAHVNLGNVLADLGQLDTALACFRKALEIKPDYVQAHSNLLFSLNHCETVDAQTLFAEHLRFAEQFEAPLRTNWPPHDNSRDTERCLRVGFVSGDLRNHAVAYFIELVLAHLAERPQLSLHAYYNHFIEDNVTHRLQKYLSHWNSVANLSDVALAEKIRKDGIDILIDLSGHTAKHRLLTFAHKPAPIQVSWIGYPCTTGLSAMDYYLADRFILPPGQFDGQFTEKIVRLPAIAHFSPYKDAPPVNALPALSNGYVTFGSFNRLGKLGPSVISLWSQLLRALPNSRMLLGSMPQDGNIDVLINLFAQEGIARERLIFHPRCSLDAYLDLHHQVDICLDTFPYNGGTTTFHALWMGVPTLTLAGHTMASRTGASVLGHIGLEAFAAHDAADFVQKGVYWAGNLAGLSDIRTGLRERFAKSAVGQPAVIAASVERALRLMWQRWCAGLPTESFEVSLQDIDSMMLERRQ